MVGAHLRAERIDRPIAYRLRERMLRDAESRGGTARPIEVMLCTDVWYLNNDDLRSRPVVSIGAPGVNALSAFLIDKVPTAFVIEGVLAVHLDVEDEDPLACCWGATPGAMASAVDAFAERYLSLFVERASRRTP